MKIFPRTTKGFTVIFQCCDPPIPVVLYNTNNENKARKIYELLEEEFRNSPGGEAILTLYKHTDKSTRKVFSVEDTYNDYGGGVFVYGIIYEGSEILKEITYMDLVDVIHESA